MSNKRIHEYSTEKNIASKKVIDVLNSLGFEVKSHFKAMDAAMVEAFENYLKKEQGGAAETKPAEVKTEVKKEADKIKIGCKTGLSVNGKTKFMLPGRGISGAVMLDGPVGQKNYNIETLKSVVEYDLKEKQNTQK